MNKVALITGNEGFVGVWVTLYLLRKGYKVYGLDNRTSIGNRLSDELKLDSKLEKQFNADICDLNTLQEIIKEIKPEVIFNLAGQAIVPRAFKEPYETFKTNTLGTLSVLEAARLTQIPKAVICITSDKVYKNNEQVWPYRENDTLGGKDVYSVSKSSAEMVCSAYAQTHLANTGINVQTVRLGNVVGGGDWSKNRLIPDIMSSIPTGGQFYIRYPLATRPFQHVLDVADGIYKIGMAALENSIETGQGWNLGPKNNTYAQVKEVIELCEQKWPFLKIEQNPDPIAEDLNLSVEIAKFKSRFSTPKYESIDALKMTINWYEQYLKGANVSKLVETDFEIFEGTI